MAVRQYAVMLESPDDDACGNADQREPGQQTRVELVCLDDDNPGRHLSVLWELELGAKVLLPETHGLGEVARLDPPRHFGAYLHALKWNSVTATDAKLFQAPFRAGIKLMNHQLTPLKKALELPRANLFIADDVGLGKTIEAGLVLQELLLRQRVEFSLIVCPASVALQWRDEMEKRFGLHFELYNRAFVGRRRQERGFGVNPWSTHNRFIITYQTLRRPEYRDPLLQHIGERIRKSLLILDEAHTAAPASASQYAIDSRVTRVIRDVAPRFENRLFLSATPHNGHSNSFSAILEILDPQRFTRGVPVRGQEQLEQVMVRRLKSDLRELGVDEFPERKVVPIDVRHEGGAWHARFGEAKPVLVGHGAAPELKLAKLLKEYTDLVRPKKGRGQLVFINLQKRLLSSIEAFIRTLRLHEKSMGAGKAHTTLQVALDEAVDGDEYGLDDEALEDAADADVATSSAEVPSPEGRARQLLTEMIEVAEEYRGAPDAKTLALLEVIAFGRLSLFGPGATRLHDEVISVAAQWLETGGPKHLKPFADGADRRALETLEQVLRDSPDLTVSAKVQQRLLGSAPADFATLWQHIHDEAEARAHAARQKLEGRGNTEADALRRILQDQRQAILDVIEGRVQLAFDFVEQDKNQRRQFEDDRKHMEGRLIAIDREIDTEPAQIKDLYRVMLKRLEPVGLIYLWPETRGSRGEARR